MTTTPGTIRYCANGCTRRHDDQRIPVQLDAHTRSRICPRCEDHLNTWLRDIPTNYALLPRFVPHGTTEQNPDSKTTKRAEVAAPMRLEVIDLLDERRGRKWQGLTPTTDRRGVIGTLQAHAERVQEERHLPPIATADVAGYCRFLTRHLLWIVEQDWVADFTTEIKQLNKRVSEAAGIYRRPPVGHCHVVTSETGTPCGGPLFAADYGGVHCARCSATWDAAHLRQLGLAQAARQDEAHR